MPPTNNSIKPEDILPDGVERTILGGKEIRKGTIAAFLANADILEDPTASSLQKQQAIETMKELAPAIIATGLYKHVNFKNKEVELLLIEAANKQS